MQTMGRNICIVEVAMLAKTAIQFKQVGCEDIS